MADAKNPLPPQPIGDILVSELWANIEKEQKEEGFKQFIASVFASAIEYAKAGHSSVCVKAPREVITPNTEGVSAYGFAVMYRLVKEGGAAIRVGLKAPNLVHIHWGQTVYDKVTSTAADFGL